MTVRFADAVEHGDLDGIDGIVALLTNDAWVTMPPAPYEYQGRNATLPSSATVPPCAAPTSGSCPPGRTDSRRSVLPAGRALGDRALI
jgi:hypothetical protein